MLIFEALAMVEKASGASVPTLPDPSIGGSLVKMFIAVAVLGACAWMIKRRASGRTQGRSILHPTTAKTRTGLRVISRQALGKGAYLAIVEWEGREVLVGITNAGISFYEESSAMETGKLVAAGELITTESRPIDSIPFPTDAMDLMSKPTRPGILDLLREQTVRR